MSNKVILNPAAVFDTELGLICLGELNEIEKFFNNTKKVFESSGQHAIVKSMRFVSLPNNKALIDRILSESQYILQYYNKGAEDGKS